MTKSADKIHKPRRTKQTKKSTVQRESIVSPERSVSFANKVKVREYGSKSKKRGKSAENTRISRGQAIHQSKENFTPAQNSNNMYGSFMPSAATAADTNMLHSSGGYQQSYGQKQTSQFANQTRDFYSPQNNCTINETGFSHQYQHSAAQHTSSMPRGQSPLRQSSKERSIQPEID